MKKTVFITGPSRGIGRQIALAFSRAGYRTALFSRSLEELNSLKEQMDGEGGESVILPGSLENYSEVEQAIAWIEKNWGFLNILVNNAGVGGFRSLDELQPADWDWMMNTNGRGTFFTTKAAFSLLKKTPSSLVINVESDVARRGFDTGSLYCASKYAQEGFTQAFRAEARKHGIRVSAIYPGLTDTTFGESQEGADHKKEWLKPQDVARTVLFVAESPPHVVIDELVIHPQCQVY